MQKSATASCENAACQQQEGGMGIRFMPSTAANGEAYSLRSSTGRNHHADSLRSMGSGTSKVSTMKWREGVQQRPLRRCLLSAMSVVMVSVSVLVASSITAVWVPSAVLADDELERASLDQLMQGAEQVSKELAGYLQVASYTSKVIGEQFNMSFATAPDTAPQMFMDEFGAGVWSMIKQAPTIASVLVAQARDPQWVDRAPKIWANDGTYVNASVCDTDVALISSTYKSNLNNLTTGPNDADADTLREQATDASPTGFARMNNVVGIDDIAEPLAYSGLKFFRRCDLWLGEGNKLWRMQNLPGTWSAEGADSGVRETTWLPGVVVAGSGASQAVYKKVFFPLEGPSWANRSAFGAVSLRVGSRKIGGVDDSTISMNDILQGVASQTQKETLLFVVTDDGMLLATSVAGQEVERLKTQNGVESIEGLIPADAGQVKEPIRTVAANLLQAHCDVLGVDEGGAPIRRCNWATVSPLQEISGHYVASKVVLDPNAANLNLLLINMVDKDLIWEPARELNTQLGVTGAIILAGACLLAFVLACMVTNPFRRARDSMFLLGDMQVEEVLGRNGVGKRLAFTETADLRLSFYHAATCLKAWREHEVERRTQLEEERERRIQGTVERAVRGAGKLVHPMVLISADSFSKLDSLTSYEELRNTSKLVYLDTEEALAAFKASHSIVFLSHQWLAWGFPDNATKTHLNAMKSAIARAAQSVGKDSGSSRCAWENVYVWVDYCSIAQEHRGMQMLAVSSLPVYASSADIFVIVAPPAEHQSSRRCDLQSYNARGWCRAEMLAKICSSGLQNFFVFGDSGALEQVTEERLPSLSMYVFEGEFSCCQQRHAKSTCDKEALVEPILGLYSLVLRQVRAGINLKHMQPILDHIESNKDRFFPPTSTFQAENAPPEQRELFGPLVRSTEVYVQELSSAECAISFDSARKKAAVQAAAAAGDGSDSQSSI